MTPIPRRLMGALVSSLAAAFCLLGLFGTLDALAQSSAGQGVIVGRAVLASAGSSAPLNSLPASLFTFINGVRQVPPVASQTDSQGRVQFGQLNTGAGYTYTLYIKFQDTIYGSNSIAFPASASTVSVTVNVYDSATESTALSISQHHLIFDIDTESRSLSVLEFYVIANGSDRAVAGAADAAAGGKRVSFRAPLPPGALVDAVEGHQLGGDVYQASDTLVDTVALPPGESSLIFSYRVPIDHSTQALAISSPFTTTALNVLVAPGIALRSPRLLSQGNVPAGDRAFQYYSARDLAAGSSIAVELSGLPAPLIPIDILQWLPLAGVSLALGVTLIIILRRRNDNAAPPRQASA